MIDDLTRTLWGVRRAAADGVPNQPPTPNNQGVAEWAAKIIVGALADAGRL